MGLESTLLANSLLDKCSKFDISLFHLIFIGNLVEKNFETLVDVLGKHDQKHDDVLLNSTGSLLIIQTVSFLDEYNHHLKSLDEDEKAVVLMIKKSLKPAVDEINKWKDLRKFRNIALAHNLRNVKTNESIFNDGFYIYDIPKTGADLLVLYQCVVMIKRAFENGFDDKLMSVEYALSKKGRTVTSPRFRDADESVTALQSIAELINKNTESWDC